jgi:DNA polymerase-3 subunit delta'
MALSELLGQPRATRLLGGSLASGRVHHAYLFAGPAGVGKTLAARLVAQALNCESPAAVDASARGLFLDDPCGACGACKRIHDEDKHHSHGLVMWISSEAEMQANGLYAPDGDRTASKAIGVRLIRELLIPRLALKAAGGRRKVAILRDVEMTDGAQNAFLKTLEEPPPDTTFIILSSTADALKPTIRSRCLRVAFQPLPLDVVAERVAVKRKVDLETAGLAASLVGGSIGAALDLDLKRLQKRRDLLVSFTRLQDDDPLGWLNLAAQLGDKESALDSLELLETWMHDVMLAATAGAPPSTHIDLAAEAAELGGRLGPRESIRRVEILRRARYAIEGNAQAQLQFERAFLEFGGLRPLSLSESAR